MADVLTPGSLTSALADRPNWSGDTAAISRSVDAPTFLDGIALVAAVAAVAEDLDHHPDIDIRWRTVSVRQKADGALIASWGRVKGTCADRPAIRVQLRRMLALDDDLTDLHDACRTMPAIAWAAEHSAGRLLRSPTVFEDLVKMLA